jgi:agmatinase
MTRFLAARPGPATSTTDAVIVGVPYDGAVTYRSGARHGPDALRRASDSIETYCPKTDRDLGDLEIVDLGNLDVEASGPTALVQSLANQLEAQGTAPILGIGGDHLVAHPFILAAMRCHPRLQILHVDAHTDLRDTWEGERFNHATVIRRVLDELVPPQRLVSWGIRSGMREELALAREDPRIDLIGPDAEAGLSAIDAMIQRGDPIYLTLDIDGIDPSDLPGTGTPEPDGLRYGVVEDAIVRLGRAALLVGADLVELAPELDPTGRSSVAAARLARAILLSLTSDA